MRSNERLLTRDISFTGEFAMVSEKILAPVTQEGTWYQSSQFKVINKAASNRGEMRLLKFPIVRVVCYK